MTVYVDDLMQTERTKKWPYTQSCHMFADSLSELHAFASRLGLRRAWFQQRPQAERCHYDLTANVRTKAIRLGAKELTRQELAKRILPNYNAQESRQDEAETACSEQNDIQDRDA